MWGAMMLCDVIAEKPSSIAGRRDFQAVAVLLAQAPARVIQMIKYAETGDWLAAAVRTHYSHLRTADVCRFFCFRSAPPLRVDRHDSGGVSQVPSFAADIAA